MPFRADGEWCDEYVKVDDWCPTCANEVTEPWVMKYCDPHVAETIGQVDHIVGPPMYIVQGEAGGEAGKSLCDLIHRGKS